MTTRPDISHDSAYDRASTRRYGAVLLTLVVGSIAAIVALQLATNPILAFPTDLDVFENRRHMSLRTAKAEALHRGGHDTVILGSSRGESGFDEHDPAWGGDEVFNGALAGSNIYEMRQMWELLERSDPPDRLLLETSLLNFSDAREGYGDFATSRLQAVQRASRGHEQTWVDDVLLRTAPGGVSMDSRLNWVLGWPYVKKAGGTLIRGLTGTTSQRYFNRNGFGVRSDVIDDNKALVEGVIRSFIADPDYYNNDAVLDEARVAMLGEIVDEAASHGVQVDIVIPPIHAVQAEVIARMDLLDEYDDLRRAVTAMAARHPSHVRAWDFSGFDGLRTEPITDATGPPMTHYFETSHFTPSTGHHILQRLYGGPDDQAMLQRMGGFGVQLLPSGVEPWIGRWHEAHQAWRDDHGDVLRWLAGLMSSTAHERQRRLEHRRRMNRADSGGGFLP